MSNHTFDLVDAAVAAASRGWKGDLAGNGCGCTKAGKILDDLLPEAGRSCCSSLTGRAMRV